MEHFLHISTKQVFGDSVLDGFPYPFGLAWGPETIENMRIAPTGGRAAGPDDGRRCVNRMFCIVSDPQDKPNG